MQSLSANRRGQRLIESAKKLRDAIRGLEFSPPITHVYNPLEYAWKPHEVYLQRYGCGRKRVVFLGMNPGPFGMTQTGVPFGEIAAVRDWLRIEAPVRRPAAEHPKRPVTGFACSRSEVSGRRLWGFFAERFGSPQEFFRHHIVINYCPLTLMESSGRNRTPDKLRPAEKASLFRHCDEHLRQVVESLKPEWVIGIGRFAEERAGEVLKHLPLKFGRILHPAPANPEANRGWASRAAHQLDQLGVWDSTGKLEVAAAPPLTVAADVRRL